MKKNQETFNEKNYYFKLAIVLFVTALIIFLSANSDYSKSFILEWIIISIISIIIYVFVARWVFKINDIVSNQEKTNQLLESINKSLSNKKDLLPDGDVNNSEYLKKIIDNLK